ncbi:GNAT family N-acetyltransferase [Peribacillus sp. SCS-155]|uniref:GNAT family N-acetyltransferase n=1 Tax=Peribacillus sedimenti TaxID=3115297 RepID=UPI003906432C
MNDELRFIKGFQENEKLRESFNGLAGSVFGISFEEWYQKGYWTDKYIPFSFTYGDKVVANVSVNLIDLLINGEKKTGIQLGTVMTDPAYRNQGLSKRLMEIVLEEYRNVDLMYLFANDTVLDFYPKFGFKQAQESQYIMDVKQAPGKKKGFRKLNGSVDKDQRLIYDLALRRMPGSQTFGTVNTAELLMFYSIYVFPEDMYYLEQQDTLVFCKEAGDQLHLFDMVSSTNIDLETILRAFVSEDTRQAILHFTPEDPSKYEIVPFRGTEVLFVKSKDDVTFPAYFKHPVTAQA